MDWVNRLKLTLVAALAVMLLTAGQLPDYLSELQPLWDQVSAARRRHLPERVYKLQDDLFMAYVNAPEPRVPREVMESVDASAFLPELRAMTTAQGIPKDTTQAIKGIIQKAESSGKLSYASMLDAFTQFMDLGGADIKELSKVFPVGVIVPEVGGKAIDQITARFIHMVGFGEVVQADAFADTFTMTPKGYARHDVRVHFYEWLKNMPSSGLKAQLESELALSNLYDRIVAQGPTLETQLQKLALYYYSHEVPVRALLTTYASDPKSLELRVEAAAIIEKNGGFDVQVKPIQISIEKNPEFNLVRDTWGSQGPSFATGALADALKSTDPALRIRALDALNIRFKDEKKSIYEQANLVTAGMLADPDVQVRLAAIKALQAQGLQDDADVYKLLAGAFDDPCLEVAQGAMGIARGVTRDAPSKWSNAKKQLASEMARKLDPEGAALIKKGKSTIGALPPEHWKFAGTRSQPASDPAEIQQYTKDLKSSDPATQRMAARQLIWAQPDDADAIARATEILKTDASPPKAGVLGTIKNCLRSGVSAVFSKRGAR